MVKTTKLNKVDQKFYEVNREYKSSLFCLSFREKEDLLELYNAINGSAYQDPEKLIIYTLEDAVYIGIKNDISFLLGEMLNLYEHQSSRNPNMPMRGLLYLARNYESYIEQNGLNVYGSMQLKFPFPQYYVFYNGEKSEPDRQELRLTDAFPKIEGKEPCLECKAILLNINYGHNEELLEKCKRLKDYAAFIHYIRTNQAKSMNLTDAVDEAIDRCIEEGILKELLVKSRGEVRNMVLSTFNKELYERDLKAEGKLLIVIELIQKKCRKDKSLQEIADELEEEVQNIESIYWLVKENPDKTEMEILWMIQNNQTNRS